MAAAKRSLRRWTLRGQESGFRGQCKAGDGIAEAASCAQNLPARSMPVNHSTVKSCGLRKLFRTGGFGWYGNPSCRASSAVTASSHYSAIKQKAQGLQSLGFRYQFKI